MFVNSVYRQFADRRPRIVKHCPDIPLLRQAKQSCLSVNMCVCTAEIAFAMPVCSFHYCFFFHIVTSITFFTAFLRHWLRVPQKWKWTAVFNAFNTVLLVQIRSTCCSGSAPYCDDLFKNTSILANTVSCFPLPVGSKKYQLLICVQSTNSPQTRP